MNWNYLLPAQNSPFPRMGAILLALLLVWSIIWKGLALWRSARRGDTAWFVIFMILNTAGILEIIYYFLIAKTDQKA